VLVSAVGGRSVLAVEWVAEPARRTLEARARWGDEGGWVDS
jgi:hypothetical protein